MLASLVSLPASALSSTASFFVNRRRGFAYAAGTVGAAYLAGKWALAKVGEQAEKARREGWGKEDLARRFNLNLQDSQFTVLALLPTLGEQVQQQLDVEARSKALGDLARREKEKKAEEARIEKERAEKEAEEEERRRHAEAEAQRAGATGEKAQRDDAPVGGAPESSAATGSSEPGPASEASSSALDPTAPSFVFNPSAPSFEPRSASASPARSASDSATPAVDADRANGHASGADGAEPAPVDGTGDETGASKSWAAVVKEGEPSEDSVVVADGQNKQLNGVKPLTPPTDPDTPPPSGPTSPSRRAASSDPASDASATAEASAPVPLPNGDAAAERDATPSIEATEEAPIKTKAELWNEIKILSFTRLFTSLYLLTLLTLQTHVQLALLGRANYVSSLVSSLPPRTPSPRPRKKGLHPAPPPAADSLPLDGADTDLELALLAAQELPPTSAEAAEAARKDVERKYLTFSYWLLHHGWRVVEQRVRKAVEEVVGPMGLKQPVVYGEVGTVLSEVRRRIDLDEDAGKPFDFSSALHPPTLAEEIQTLIAGGSYTPSPPPSASSHSSSSSYPPQSTSRPSSDPISPALRALLSETADALDSPDAALIRSLMLDKLLSLAIEKLEPAFVAAPSVQSGSAERGARFEDVTEKVARLASLLPLLTRMTGKEDGVLTGGMAGTEWVEALEDVRELREFAAVLYGSWDKENARASG
ncbi:hypothetical protein JCM10207_000265 [Rhodosporidiobolus poonsookiae]